MLRELATSLTLTALIACSPAPTPQVDGVIEDTRLSCMHIVSGSVTEQQIEAFITSQMWTQWEIIAKILNMESLIESQPLGTPLWDQGEALITQQYDELNLAEKEQRSSEELRDLQEDHLIQLLALISMHTQLKSFFPDYKELLECKDLLIV